MDPGIATIVASIIGGVCAIIGALINRSGPAPATPTAPASAPAAPSINKRALSLVIAFCVGFSIAFIGSQWNSDPNAAPASEAPPTGDIHTVRQEGRLYAFDCKAKSEPHCKGTDYRSKTQIGGIYPGDRVELKQDLTKNRDGWWYKVAIVQEHDGTQDRVGLEGFVRYRRLEG